MNASVARAAPPGSTIGVVTPGSPPETRAEVQRGIAWWESKGYRVKLMPGALEQDGWHAGSPEVRAADLQAAFADPEIDAIQTMRGGYGSPQVIPLLDFDAIAETPKAFVGLSDITALHAALLVRGGTGDVLRAESDDVRQPVAVAVHHRTVPARACRRDGRPRTGGSRPSDRHLDRRREGERPPGRWVSPRLHLHDRHPVGARPRRHDLLLRGDRQRPDSDRPCLALPRAGRQARRGARHRRRRARGL